MPRVPALQPVLLVRLRPVVPALALTLAACSKAEEAKPAAESAATPVPVVAEAPSVQITAPAEGDSVSLPVTITLAATGVVVAPADGKRVEGTGHHHLVIDGDVPSDTLPLPKPPVVIHLGSGATQWTSDSLAKGPHRVIAVFAYGDHVPMATARRDTVTFVVK